MQSLDINNKRNSTCLMNPCILVRNILFRMANSSAAKLEIYIVFLPATAIDHFHSTAGKIIHMFLFSSVYFARKQTNLAIYNRQQILLAVSPASRSHVLLYIDGVVSWITIRTRHKNFLGLFRFVFAHTQNHIYDSTPTPFLTKACYSLPLTT